MLKQAQVLLKRSCTFGKLVNIQITEFTLLCTGKNNICISCVFNGFKYSNFPFLDGDVPRSPSYGVHISQLIRFASVCSKVDDFNNRNLFLTA